MSFDWFKHATKARGLKSTCRRLARALEASSLPTRSLSSYRAIITSLFASPEALIPGVLACWLTPYLCWREAADDSFAVILALAIAIGLGRIGSLCRYRLQKHDHDDRRTTRRWDREFILGATLMSSVMGINGYLLFTRSENLSAQILVVAVNTAIGSGYVARNAARPLFALLQLLLFIAPVAAALIISPVTSYAYTGWLLCLYFLVNISIVFQIHRNIVRMTTARKTADWLSAQLQRQNQTLEIALDTMPHGAAMFEANLRLAVANARHFALFGLPADFENQGFAATQQHLVDHGVISGEMALKLGEACRTSIAKRVETQVELATMAGAHLIVHFNPSSAQGFLMFTEDATARRKAESEVQRLARYDTLTGLPNRHEFSRRLARTFEELGQGGPAFALLYLDLDGFKRINDSLGHDAGDRLLVEVSQRLKRNGSRETMICRLGGDEFAAICALAPAAVSKLAQEITASLQEPFVIGKAVSRIGVSIGVAFAPGHGANAEELLRHADIALYRAKAEGRGATVVYDDAMAEELTERMSLEADIMAALAADAFELHFQPIVDLSSGAVVSYEALARWPHPTRGLVPPSVFIPIAEQTGCIDRLGSFAIREACAIASGWDPSISVSVNVSVMQFRNPNRLVDCVRNSLAAHRLAPQRLVLEITESLFIDQFEETISTIQRMTELGVRFALDDFGAGYSSLSLLGRLPLSIVKIDRSLTKDVARNTTSYAIVEAVCALAKRIDLIVVVEGVETREQQVAVRLTGADRAQGWLFGRPEPAARLPHAVTKISAA
ncbi:MAG TPA: EAL domain-containing protein [Methylocystis sp.]|nr:EAL domain-containing protein [Methylocystis sp.]